MVEVRILGCGSSLGVPVIGCQCQVCISPSTYNKRLKCSLLICSEDKNILVDFGHDIRQQLLRENVKKINSAILTHIHSDHVSGIDDLRPFYLLHNFPPVKIYSDETTFEIFNKRFDYLDHANYFTKFAIDYYEKLLIEGIEFQFFKQDHGNVDSLGFRIGNFAYANDLIAFYDESKKYLYNLDNMIVDCVSYESAPTHSGLDKVLLWYEEFRPQNMYLTNMGHKIDFFDIQKKIPHNIKPLYDGQIIKLQLPINSDNLS